MSSTVSLNAALIPAQPRVSVCIATYNRKDYLRQAIASVLKQSFSAFELIICDDGSTDGTAEYIESLDDARLRYIRHTENIGKSNNMRSGFAAAKGRYFIKFDDDDRLTPDYLERTVAVLDDQPSVDFVSTGHWVIDAAGRRDLAVTEENAERWGRTRLNDGVLENLLQETFVHQSLQIGTTLFRRSALLEMDYMRADLQNCEDNDLLVRLALAGKRAYFLSARLMEYRFHEEQKGFAKGLCYLSDKVAYLEFFQFEDPAIEKIRRQRLAECKMTYGLWLIEDGRLKAGRRMLWAGRQAASSKAIAGLLMSCIPKPVREQAFSWVRRSKAAAQQTKPFERRLQGAA